jgi:hypothetical protein
MSIRTKKAHMPLEEKYSKDFAFDWTIEGAKVIPIKKVTISVEWYQ